MKLLIVPMFALSPMNGPWSRAQRIARAFMEAGHEVVLGIAPDGNCRDAVTERVLELPVPSPLGAPMAIAKRTFPIAQKLGIAGRKPVRSFEEVLWLTGNLAYGFLAESVRQLRAFIRSEGIDAVYSEFSIPAIVAARAEDVLLFGTHSFPTQASYASAPQKAAGLRRLLAELGQSPVESALELFERIHERFIPSCRELEPFEGAGNVRFCGFLAGAPAIGDGSSSRKHQTGTVLPAAADETESDALILYTGTVPMKTLVATAKVLATRTPYDVYLAGVDPACAPGDTPGKLHVARRFDFRELLPRAAAFVNHGGQNSVMDALAYGAPQIVYPGKVFERLYNGDSIARAGAGICLSEFTADAIEAALTRLATDVSFCENAARLRCDLAALGGTATIVDRAQRITPET